MESQKILYNNYEYYTSLDAIKQLIEKKPHLAQHFLYEDETGEIFRLIIGEENQVENLKKVLSFESFKKLYASPLEFGKKLSLIRTTERISFIKDFIGIQNFFTLCFPLLTLKLSLIALPYHARYDFLINDFGIDNFKKIMYNSGSDSCSYFHKGIGDLFPKKDFLSLRGILFDEEQQLAWNKLQACRDAIEHTNFITNAGKCSLHGCREIKTKDGKIKLVSDTAAYILHIMNEQSYILSNHVNTFTEIREICKRALAYDKINPTFKESMVGTAIKFAIWMTRTNEAMELYAKIAEDKLIIEDNTLISAKRI